MKYLVYTDGAHDSETGGIASGYVVRTKLMFILEGGYTEKQGNIGIAEALAVGKAIETLMEKRPIGDRDIVEIFTDSKFVIETYKGVRDGEVRKFKDSRLEYTWNVLTKLNETCAWKFKKVRSHCDDINENKYVDRLAKYYLKLQ